MTAFEPKDVMKKEEVHCIEYLEILRKNWLEANDLSDIPNGMNLLHNSLVVVKNKSFTESIYSETNDERILVVLELSRKAFIGSVHYAIGVEKLSGIESSYLSMQDIMARRYTVNDRY